MGAVLSSSSTTEEAASSSTVNPTHPEIPASPPAGMSSPSEGKEQQSTAAESDHPTKEADPARTEEEQQSAAGESDQPTKGEGDEEEEEEEERECGFCLFMKGGACKDAFIAWEDCVKVAEDEKEDMVAKCSEVTKVLKDCLEANPDYYGPILQAEKKAEEQAMKEMREEEEQRKAADAEALTGTGEVVVVEEEASG